MRQWKPQTFASKFLIKHLQSYTSNTTINHQIFYSKLYQSVNCLTQPVHNQSRTLHNEPTLHNQLCKHYTTSLAECTTSFFTKNLKYNLPSLNFYSRNSLKKDRLVAIFGLFFALVAVLFLTNTVISYATNPIVPVFLQTLIPIGWYSIIIIASVAFLVKVARTLWINHLSSSIFYGMLLLFYSQYLPV